MNKYLIITIVILALIIGGFYLTSNLTGNSVNLENLNKLTLDVSIPCGGHASLIRNELYKLNGVEQVDYAPITTFIVYYDSVKISEAEILGLSIFKEYPAKKL